MMYKKLMKAIKKYNTIIIHRHGRPDGDALGSQLGLAQAIRDNYRKKTVYVVGDMNDRLSWLGQMDEIDDSVYENSLVIICDVAVSTMVSDDRYKNAKEVWIIDHHTNKSDIVDDNHFVVDHTRSACAELIADTLFTNKWKISKEAALPLYTGIVTDSGRFQYNETNPKTFIVAALLLQTGIDIQSIYDKLYVETLEQKKLKAQFTDKFKLTANNVAYIINTKEDMEALNIDFFAVSRGMVNVMAGIDGINIWAQFTYDATKDAYIGEFRSRGLSIVDIAKKYGGGGHDQACGATLTDMGQVNLVLVDFDKRMEEFRNETNSKGN